jgi:hypothetical protein
MYTKFWTGDLNARDDFGDVGVDENILSRVSVTTDVIWIGDSIYFTL